MTTPSSGPLLTLEEALTQPVPSGSMRVVWCRGCGAITGILTPDGLLNGDPELHGSVCPQNTKPKRTWSWSWSWSRSRKEN